MRIVSVIRALSAYLRLQWNRVNGANVQCTKRNHFGKDVSLYFDKGSRIILGKDIGLRNNVCVSARPNAEIIIGNNVF